MFDIIFVLPYPAADHPSFPEGLLKRNLEAAGFSVGIIATPDWQKKEAFQILGTPKLFFAVISGPVDSLIANYTSLRKRRNEDQYQFAGRSFFPDSAPTVSSKIRPDRTIITFCSRIREAFKSAFIVIGGVEASTRIFAHYDFISDQLRRSIILDSRADLLITGNGEQQIIEIARRLRGGACKEDLLIAGTAAKVKSFSADTLILPSYEDLLKDRSLFIQATYLINKNYHKKIAQQFADQIVQKMPQAIYSSTELDEFYKHQFTRRIYQEKLLTPALKMNLFSITTHRGCGGGCSFCSINLLQGKQVISRSPLSIIREAEDISSDPLFEGVITDLGGASSQLYGADCSNFLCAKNCFQDMACRHRFQQKSYLNLLRTIRKLRFVEKVFVGSGFRYDLFLENQELLEEIITYHCGNYLRIAPEHFSDEILRLMGKPNHDTFRQFVLIFQKIKIALKSNVKLKNYVIIGFPGETKEMLIDAAKKFKQLHAGECSLQIFTPLPGTMASAYYYSEMDLNGKSIYVEKNIKKLAERKALFLKLIES